MPGEFRNSYNKVAGSILASTIIFLVGALSMAFVAAAGGGDPVSTLLVIAGLVVFVLCTVWLFTRASTLTARSAYNWVFSKSARPDPEYQPQRVESRTEQYGNQRPISLDEVKELKDDLRNWVPSRTRSSRSRPQ